MDDETRRHLFEPFYTTKATGRGLGMATVLGIVRGHHGAIDVDTRLGQGSRMRILFPVKDGAAGARRHRLTRSAGAGTWGQEC